MEQWRTFPGVAGRPKLPQERSNNSSRRSQKTPQQHPKNCRPHLPQLREAATNGDTINLEEYTTSVTSYISKCIDDVTVSKTITTRSNQKPWMTAEAHALLKSRDKG
ncbi:hypothetical protein QTP70_013457 [Hemibagrus guttatus]|uniref:Uncharacterized protein n=1 Tax=Hemibagrus guttatus TaxID=175788 RepID=A0AAE0Q823_9TELE|nr:hypothetical protein QTP70_013457 [Hemibagrus guttatus]